MSPIIHGRAFSQSNLDQRLFHSIGVISFYKSLASTRIAAGLLFRASRPQLAKAVNQNRLSRRRFWYILYSKFKSRLTDILLKFPSDFQEKDVNPFPEVL
jgi:hypothetical protein